MIMITIMMIIVSQQQQPHRDGDGEIIAVAELIAYKWKR